MIFHMPDLRSITPDTRILDLSEARIPRFGQQSARQLALALTESSPGKDSTNVTIEDLLEAIVAYQKRDRRYGGIKSASAGPVGTIALTAK